MSAAVSLLAVLLFALSLAACGASNATPTPTPTTGGKIAVIDGERMDSTHAKRADFLLSRIAGWCADSPSEERVADMAAMSKNILRDDYGLDVTVLDVLEGANDSTSSATAGIFSCADTFTLYVILSGQ